MANEKKKVYQITASKYQQVQATDVLLGNIVVGLSEIGDQGSLEDTFKISGFPFIISEKIVEVDADTPMTLAPFRGGLSERVKPSRN